MITWLALPIHFTSIRALQQPADLAVMSILLSSLLALQQQHDRSDIPHLAWPRRLPMDSSRIHNKETGWVCI